MEFKSITPDVLKVYTGPQTVQALMNVFDAEYSRSHLSTTISVSGGKFSQLTTAQADAKYPRAAWLQLLLEKGITIENFREYASYLSKRHTLVFLEENPDLWKSGFLGIQPIDDWETYKATYINKLIATQAQIEHAKKRFTSQQFENARKQFECSRKALELVKKLTQ